MIRGGEFHDIIYNIFQDVNGLHDSEQLQCNCPRCQERDGLPYPDGKFNLEINTAKRVFRCWKCDDPPFSGTLGRLVRMFGSNTDYELYKSYAQVFQDYEYDEDEKEFIQVKLPQEMIYFSQMDSSNPDHYEAYNYLVNERMIPRDTILKYRLGFCPTGKYGGRIIVPSFDMEGEINYFVGRAYKKELKRPYQNPYVDKRHIIFNEGLINWDSTIYLVEGVFEMLSFPVNTVPLLGKDLLDALFTKLSQRKPHVVILMDPDAYRASIELFYKLQSVYYDNEEKIRIVKLSGKYDLDEIKRFKGHDAVIEALYGARKLNVDDYFAKKIYYNGRKSRRYNPYSKYSKRGSSIQ